MFNRIDRICRIKNGRGSRPCGPLAFNRDGQDRQDGSEQEPEGRSRENKAEYPSWELNIQYPTLNIQCPSWELNIQYPTLNIQYPTRNIQCPSLELNSQYPIRNIQCPSWELNIQYPTRKIQKKAGLPGRPTLPGNPGFSRFMLFICVHLGHLWIKNPPFCVFCG